MASEQEGNHVSAKTPVGEIRVSGTEAVLLLGFLALAGGILWQASVSERQHAMLQRSVFEVSQSLDQVLWSNLLTAEQKLDLPIYIREKARRKVEEVAETKP